MGALSYINTLNFVSSTNNREAAINAIRKSEPNRNPAYMSRG